jgi:hypothetical protein
MKHLPGIEITTHDPRPAETAITAAEPVKVCWEFWRTAQQRSYHGAQGIVELGEIGDDE